MTQEQFAGVAGVQRRAQVTYEKDERRPDADYLAAIATAGADVQYIVTGVRAQAAGPGVPGELWRDLMALVIDELSQAGLELAGDKVLELVDLLHAHFAKEGQIDRDLVRRHLKLVV